VGRPLAEGSNFEKVKGFLLLNISFALDLSKGVLIQLMIAIEARPDGVHGLLL
jgi:hypothetical protein